MRRTTKLSLALLLVAAVAHLGCCADPAPVAAAPPPKPAPPPRPAAPAPKPAAPAPCGVLGDAQTMAALPTGEMDCGGVVSVLKTAPKQVPVGQPFDYHITVTNLTRKPLTEVMLTEKFSENFQVTSTSPKANLDGSTAVWAVGDMDAKASQTFVVRGSAKTVGTVNGCAFVAFRIPEVCLAVQAVQPMLRIAKTGPDEVLACDPITYRIVVSNTGSGPACNVVVRDVLPEGMVTAEGEKSAAFNVGTLMPGQAKEMLLQVRADKTGRYANHATAVADGGLTAQSEQVVTTIRKPVLLVAKTGPKIRYMGLPATYEITVTNKGDGVAKDTVLEDTIPAGAAVVSATGGATSTGGKVLWKLGNIAPEESKKVQITMRLDTLGVVRNVASATCYCGRGLGETVTEVKGIPAILLECIDLQDPVPVGGQTTYVITVTNQGSAVGTGIVIDCTLPEEQEFVSATGPTKETVKDKSVTFAPLATLAPQAKATYQVTIKGVKAGDVRFGVKLTSDQMDSPATETESTRQFSE